MTTSLSPSPPDLDSKQIEFLREYEARARERPWSMHLLATVVPKIRPFHESRAEFRLLRGPNGGGKSVSGAAELVAVATGYHPIRGERFETPNVTWAICLDYKNAGRVMRRRLMDMLPTDGKGKRLWKYYKQDSLFVLDKSVGGSEIYMKQQAEGPTSLYAERCTAEWIDEIKPGQMGEDCFSELTSRYSAGKRLCIFVTATPEWGADWARRRFDDPTAEEYIQGSEVFEFSLYDCIEDRGGFLTLAEVERQDRLAPPEQRAARIHGRWANFVGSPHFSVSLLLGTMDKARSLPGKRVSPKLVNDRWVLEDDPNGKIILREDVKENEEYIAAWDPGAGRKKDRHGLAIIKRSDLTISAFAQNNDMDPMWFGGTQVMPLATYFNECVLVHEVNGESGEAATECVRENYPNLYMRRLRDKSSSVVTDHIGWRTTGAAGGTGGTRGLMLATLDRVLREGEWNPPQELLDEMMHMVKKPDGKVEHQDGAHDDLAMAVAIGLCVHFEDTPMPPINWNRYRIRYKQEPFAAHTL